MLFLDSVASAFTSVTNLQGLWAPQFDTKSVPLSSVL